MGKLFQREGRKSKWLFLLICSYPLCNIPRAPGYDPESCVSVLKSSRAIEVSSRLSSQSDQDLHYVHLWPGYGTIGVTPFTEYSITFGEGRVIRLLKKGCICFYKGKINSVNCRPRHATFARATLVPGFVSVHHAPSLGDRLRPLKAA